MTRERRLAIQMWEEIKEMLPKWYTVERYVIGQHVLAYKYKFCIDNQVHWKNDCWLCQYARITYCNCERCPLKTCGYTADGEASPWQVIMQRLYSLKEKLAAWDTIIAVLKGTNKREEIQA